MADIVEVVIGNVLRAGGSVLVIDDLTSTNATAALSANQGRELADMIEAIGPGGEVQSVAGKTGIVTLVKADVGLANVDNTSDANKPVSTAQATAIALKEPAITAGTTGQYYRGDKTFQTLDKTVVGLPNVDNTSDANKPVSTATQTALNLKANTSSLATVATSGSYPDLSNKPQIVVQSTMPSDISGYPDGTIFIIG